VIAPSPLLAEDNCGAARGRIIQHCASWRGDAETPDSLLSRLSVYLAPMRSRAEPLEEPRRNRGVDQAERIGSAPRRPFAHAMSEFVARGGGGGLRGGWRKFICVAPGEEIAD